MKLRVSDTTSDESIPAGTEGFGVAVGWGFVMNTAQTVSTLLTALVLANLLGPESYGSVAAALIFITLLQMLSEQGMAPAVIQRANLTRRHLDTAFWLTMSFAVVLCGASWLLSGWWARLNDAVEVGSVVRVLSVLVIARGLTVVQEALLERQLQYRALALRTAAASIAGAVAGIGYAIVERTMWAFVVQQVTMAVVGVVVLWSVAAWRPRFRFAIREARELMSFSGRVMLSSIAVFVNTRVDAMLVGVYFGITAIGLYRLADRLVQAAIQLSTRPVQRVGLPEFSRHQLDPAQTRERYLSLSSAAAAVGASVMAIVFASARPLMDVVGEDWSDAATVLQLLCVVGMVRVITMVNGPAVVGAGRPGAQASLNWMSAVLSAAAFASAGIMLTERSLGVQVVGMAASRAVLYVVVLLPLSQAWLIRRFVGVRGIEFARAVAPSVLVSVFTAACGALLARVLTSFDWPGPVVLVIVGMLTGAAVIPLNLRASPEAWRIVQQLVKRFRS